MDRSMIDTSDREKTNSPSLYSAHALMEQFILGQVFCSTTVSGVYASWMIQSIIKLLFCTAIENCDDLNDTNYVVSILLQYNTYYILVCKCAWISWQKVKYRNVILENIQMIFIWRFLIRKLILLQCIKQTIALSV